MARRVEMEVRLSEWAAWRAWQPELEHPGEAPRTRGRDAIAGSPELAALDRAISMLPPDLAVVVTQVYRARATMPEHARRLGCPEAVIARRIGRAHRLLIDLLETRLSDDAREHERLAMSERLAKAHGKAAR